MMTFWNQIKNKIAINGSKNDSHALNDNIRELFNNFKEIPQIEAWNLVKKVYNEYEYDYMMNMALAIGITDNFDIIPDKKEAWDIFENIPNNIDPILKTDAIIFMISQLRYNAKKINAKKAWNFLEKRSNDNDPQIRGETGFALYEFIIENKQFPKAEAWNKIESLLSDPNKNVKEKIVNGFSYFYSDLPKDKIWDLTLKLSKTQSKKVKEASLNVAIEKSREQVKTKDYLNASMTLKQILKELNSCYRIGLLRFFLLGLIFVLGIYIVKDIWLYVLNQMPYFLIGIALLMLIFWKILKLKSDKYMVLIYFTIFVLPIMLLFPLPYVILNFIHPISLTIYNLIIFALIPSFVLSFIMFSHINVSIKLISKNPRQYLAEGLCNYYTGRYYVQCYINSKDYENKLDYLKKAIKKFSKATDCYNKLLFGFENELSICPYCLNFYQGIDIYENLLREPKDSNVKELEKNIENSIKIMENTSKGSEKINKLLNELLKVTKLIVELEKERKKFSELDSINRIKIDSKMKEKGKDIEKIIMEIEIIISNIEDQKLPLIIEIMNEKKSELSDLSLELKKEGYHGFNKYYSKERYSKIGIIILTIGIILAVMGSLFTSTYIIIGVTISIIGSFITAFAKIKII